MSRIERYWQQFLASLPEGAETPAGYLEAFHFGSPEAAREIAGLVLDGTKTATGSVLWALEADCKQLPAVGDHSIVTDGGEQPLAVIRTTRVDVLPFSEVGEEYARAGGEGDRTLACWREMYWSYIRSECERIGREPSRDAPLVMERFELVYGEPPVD